MGRYRHRLWHADAERPALTRRLSDFVAGNTVQYTEELQYEGIALLVGGKPLTISFQLEFLQPAGVGGDGPPPDIAPHVHTHISGAKQVPLTTAPRLLPVLLYDRPFLGTQKAMTTVRHVSGCRLLLACPLSMRPIRGCSRS